MIRELKNRYTHELQYRGDHEDSKALLMAAVEAGAFLDSVDFIGANLSEARLRGAKMSQVDFSRADLTHADMRGAVMHRTYMSDANLTHANLIQAVMAESSFTRATLCDAKLGLADLRNSYMQGADLRRADMSRAILKGTDLRKADLRTANLDGADLREAHFEGAKVGSEDDHAVLVGQRPVIQIGPIGSRDGYLMVFWCGDAGIRISTSCQRQFIRQMTEEQFLSRLSEDSEKNRKRQTYLDALAFAKRMLEDQANCKL